MECYTPDLCSMHCYLLHVVFKILKKLTIAQWKSSKDGEIGKLGWVLCKFQGPQKNELVHPFSCGFSYSSSSQLLIKHISSQNVMLFQERLKPCKFWNVKTNMKIFLNGQKIQKISSLEFPQLAQGNYQNYEVWPLGQSSLTHMWKWVHGLFLTTPHPSCTQKDHWMSKHQIFGKIFQLCTHMRRGKQRRN